MAMPLEHEYVCLMVQAYKTADTKKAAHLKNMRGRYIVLYVSQMPPAATEGRLPRTGHMVDELRQHWPEVSDMSMMLNSPWPEGCERSDGCAWASLVLVGENVTETCCRGSCTHDCDAHTADSNVSSKTWYTRKNLCVPRNWHFKHATRILDVIMLEYPLKVRLMPGIWVCSWCQSQPFRGGAWTLSNAIHCKEASEKMTSCMSC
jgi:hypothetical protein